MSTNADSNQEKKTEKDESTLYRGKWTPEEEAYAHCLIAEFRAGTLGIPSGTTLRGFLAKKLKCAPKRVSKKFENSGYNGKQLYCSSIVYISNFESQFRKRNLEFLRQRFLISRGLPGKVEVLNTPQDFLIEQSNVSNGSLSGSHPNVLGTSFLDQRLNESVMNCNINRPGFLGDDSSSRIGLLNLSSRLANTRSSPTLGPASMVDQGRVQALRRDLQASSADSALSWPAPGVLNRVASNSSTSLPPFMRSQLSANAIANYSKALSNASAEKAIQQQQQQKRAPSPLEASLNHQSLLNNRAELLRQTLGFSNGMSATDRTQLQRMLANPNPAQLSLLQAGVQAENRKRQMMADNSGASNTGLLMPPTKRSKMF